MPTNRILALALLILGLILIFTAYQSSQSLGEQVTEAVTGGFTDATAWLLFLGAAAAVAGSAMTGVELLLFGKTTKK
ncbi:DUF3185 family protein [Marinobacter zhanjiangensis]|uniref:Uncharacterized protein n=1 Tax=Marinobacter zhanjiangensis TaxID=578215 RepID=A0ABQ3ARX7_9GAMM|nr:DUF3185 family protein [Marinobacter zhanjiangensis]GGY65957.1 hypothetical protein GCM10007071_10920 [Marinobacter zhanjiangensis]